MTIEQDDVISVQPVPAPSTVGAMLKGARQAMGKDLPEVASHLRIRQPFLAALEDGRHKDLPGGTYAVGFLRTYAEFLALDGEEMVRLFKLEAAGDLNSRAELVFPSPVTEGRIPGGALLFLGLVLAGIAYGGWYWLSSKDRTVAEMVPPIPDRLAVAKPAEPIAAAPGPDVAQPDAPGPDGKADAPKSEAEPVKASEMVPPAETEDDKAAKPVATTETKPDQPVAVAPTEAKPADVKPVEAKPAETRIVGSDTPDARIVLKASGDDCWVQVREMDGQLLLSRLLRKGDTYMVPNRPGLSLMVGNAGALEIAVDGKRVPSLGTPGQVRRDIKLDPDKLAAGG